MLGLIIKEGSIMAFLKLKPALAVALVGASCLSLSACSLPNAEVNFDRYTLTLDIDPNAYLSPYDIDLTLAPVLDQGGVVIQMSDVSLRPAKNYRYSSDLDNELRLLFIDEALKANMPKEYEQLKTKIYVSKFQGTLDGFAIVSLSVQVCKGDNKQVLFQKAYSQKSKISEDGYNALVSELKNSYLKQVRSFIIDYKDR